MGCFLMGVQLHSHLIKAGFSQNVYINTSLMDMYSKCAGILWAHKLFDEMPQRNAITWSALISGYVKARDPTTAVELFATMIREGVCVTPFGVSSALVACAQLKDGELGAQVHDLGLKLGVECNVAVGSSLIDMYAKCGNLEDSRKVFDALFDKNSVVWTSMIGGYAYNHCPNKSMILIREMFRSGIKANYVSYNSLLSSFHVPEDFMHCCQIHCRVIQEGLDSNSFLMTTLVTVYSECACSLEDYYKIISNVVRLDQIGWNAVIAGFSNLGVGDEAFVFFLSMRRMGLDVDYFTLSSVLKAVGKSSSLEEGKQIHSLVSKTRYVRNLNVQNALVSMYARCGRIEEAKKVFFLMDEHDLISWNSLLTACAHHGHGKEAVEMFEQMRKIGVNPNPATFLAVLTACSHVELLEKGLEYFSTMEREYFLRPRLDHYTCIVDMYGRAGFVDEAEAFINRMPISIKKGASVYRALLSACQVHGNKEIGARTARKLVELCPNDPAIYVLLANVLANEGSWDDAFEVRKQICSRGMVKKVAISWI